MEQIAQSGHTSVGHARDIALGGMCAWRLPSDATSASVARSLVSLALTTLRLDRDTADDVTLAASELATNALHHGRDPAGASAPPELWVWGRTTPTPQLVITVFDGCRSSWPDSSPKDLLADHGKGLGIVDILAEAWGAHPSRSICTRGAPGKAVWVAFPLPGPWPNPKTTAPPLLAARHLAAMLSARGVARVTHRPGRGISLVTVPIGRKEETNIWVEPGHLSYTCPKGSRQRRPMVDLHDVTETLIHDLEKRSAHR